MVTAMTGDQATRHVRAQAKRELCEEAAGGAAQWRTLAAKCEDIGDVDGAVAAADMAEEEAARAEVRAQEAAMAEPGEEADQMSRAWASAAKTDARLARDCADRAQAVRR